jgi:hypothetical protein
MHWQVLLVCEQVDSFLTFLDQEDTKNVGNPELIALT